MPKEDCFGELSEEQMFGDHEENGEDFYRVWERQYFLEQVITRYFTIDSILI